MRKKQVSSQAILPLEQRIRVADLLLLLINIDKRLSLEAKAKKTAKAKDAKTKNDVDTGSRLSRALFIYFFKELRLISKPTACKTALSELKRGLPALESILYRFCLLRSVFSAK